jgi:hypothetical protein
MNTYSKYVPNVFLAKCTEQHERGSIIPVTTQYGKNNDSIVYNLIFQRDGFYYYSIVRADGFNTQERAKAKAAKYINWAASAGKQSDEYFTRSNKDADFLKLGEPIKVGHHSEKRHRKIFEERDNNMRKCVEMSDKAEAHENKAEFWEGKASDINLSMPECIEFYEYKLEKAKEYHAGVKSGKYPKEHSFTLTYAKKEANELEKKLQLALKLWA